jgi:predicted secreted hydrolase
MPNRRHALAWLTGLLIAPDALAQAAGSSPRAAPRPSPVTPFAPVVPGYRMRFPHDEGSHPEFRLEWWYVTGWLDEATRPLGFQITFFRARPDLKHDNPSAFTPRQIMIAHAALSDPVHGRLIHGKRAAREGFALAGPTPAARRSGSTTGGCSRKAGPTGPRFLRAISPFDLALDAVQPHLLQEKTGSAVKAPRRSPLAHYYSIPHLNVSGLLNRNGKPQRITGSAWLDHEWSSQYMEQDAVGWDWIGINLSGGGAFMAFRMRDKQGGSLWAGGALRRADGSLRVFAPADIRFTPGRAWRSARTGASCPLHGLSAGDIELAIEPLFDDQEHDTRASTGTIYWEGARDA